MVYWSLIATILLAWSNYSTYVIASSLYSFTTDTGEPVSHVVRFGNTYFIGSTNFIYQVDEHFNTLQTLSIRSNENNEDNFVTMMLVSSDPDKPVLFWCGSVDLGLCHVNLLHNLNAGDFLHEGYFTDKLQEYYDKHSVENRGQLRLMEHGTYGHLGSRAGSKAIFIDVSENEAIRNATESTELILASATYDGRQNRSLPRIGIYSLRKSPDGVNYFIKPTMFNPFRNKFSYLAVYMGLLHQYPISHVSMFESGDYVYVIANQRARVEFPLERIPFQTRIGRFNKTDLLFQSYIEVPVRCEASSHDYNIVVDAFLGLAALDLRSRLHMGSGSAADKVLYFLQGESTDLTSYPTLNSAAVCALPLSVIDAHMDRQIRRCHNGAGQLAEWYYGRAQPCQTTTVINQHGDVEKRALYLLVKGRTLSLETIRTLPYNATMLHTEVQGETTVAVVGNNEGQLQKINLATGSVYHSLAGGSGDDHVTRDSLLTGDVLVAVAGSKVVAYPLRSCELYDTAESCTATDDPLDCGWCGGERCTTRSRCAGEEWYHHAPTPQIHSIFPNNGSIFGNTTLTITGSYFTLTNQTDSSSISVLLYNTSCRITAIQFKRVVCVTGPVSTPWTGLITIIRHDTIGSISIPTRGYSTSGQLFSYLRVQYIDITPFYGPILGGTTVTLTGKNLLLGNSVSVRVGDVGCDIQRITVEMLTCVTLPLATPRTVQLVLLSDGRPQFTTSYTYKPNPVIDTLASRTAHTILSGGIPICFNGRHVDSINFPLAEFYFPQLPDRPNQPLIQNCFMRTSSKLCCPIPDLTKHMTMNVASNTDTIHSEVVLRMDSDSLPAGLVLYHSQPVVYAISALRKNSADTISISIKGQGFEYLDSDFLNITTSHGVVCSVQRAEKALIMCSLIRGTDDSTREQNYTTLILQYGNLVMNLGNVRIERSAVASDRVIMKEPGPPFVNMLVIYVVSLLAATIAIVVSACLIVKRMRKKSTTTTNEPSVSYIHCPENAVISGTTIAFEENEAYLGIQHSSFGTMPTLQTVALRENVRARGALIELPRLHMGAEIGSGCFGKVFKGFLDEETNGHRISHRLVAIKAVKGSQISTEDVNTFVDEALLMQTFRHDHVLTMLGISFDVYGQPLVVLPFLGKGDLRSYLKNASNDVTTDDKLGFANDIAMGMNYLEDVLCVHRDLAARNCMLDDNLRVKVADFGLSRDLDNFENKLYESTAKTAKLPVKWMSPESLFYRHYSSKTDVWAYGVTLWEIFSRGAYPYPNIDNFEILEHVKAGGRLDKPANCPPEIYELMCSTWRFDAEARPNFAYIVNDLQLFIANRCSCSAPVDSQFVPSHDALSQRTRSSDSGNHSDLDTLQQVMVEEYLVPMPSYNL